MGEFTTKKAISLHQPWANWIALGNKTIETRFRRTKYRGDLVICSTKFPEEGVGPFGYALCIVELYDCRPMRYSDESGACIAYNKGRWAWMLRNLRRFTDPFRVSGHQGFFNLEVDMQENHNETIFRRTS